MEQLCYNKFSKTKGDEVFSMSKETLGKVIESRRTELGITQRELARGVKRSNSTISRIESDNGLTPLAFELVRKHTGNPISRISKKFDISSKAAWVRLKCMEGDLDFYTDEMQIAMRKITIGANRNL